MRKALISPKESAKAPDGSFATRIVQVEDAPFPVHPDLFWADCPDECDPITWYYLDGQCVAMPERPPETE
jgi:hypothetical protein